MPSRPRKFFGVLSLGLAAVAAAINLYAGLLVVAPTSVLPPLPSPGFPDATTILAWLLVFASVVLWVIGNESGSPGVESPVPDSPPPGWGRRETCFALLVLGSLSAGVVLVLDAPPGLGWMFAAEVVLFDLAIIADLAALVLHVRTGPMTPGARLPS
ncbi:MAG TPA: hypothetical protein VGP88_05030 [Thermoplasmata archaeon]|jgi:hypothetical protein|nr:hypothetical protein [Thermoplasmata archaeon]